MNLKEALHELESAGTAQNRKVYARHGIGEDMYGVSFANLGKLAKKIKRDHELALALWDTGNHDARVLATMVADAGSMTAAQLESWAKGLDNYIITDSFAGFAAKTPHARNRSDKWRKSRSEWIASAGYGVLSHLAMDCKDLEDAYFEEVLDIIGQRIHTRKNRVRHSMNNALIAIGIRNPALQKKAIAATKRIGKVEVDHGETSCKTPDAEAYILKTMAHRRRKKACC